MVVLYSALAILGFGGVVFGFWGQHALNPPYDTLAAVLLPLSLVLGLGAVLLLCVPHFWG